MADDAPSFLHDYIRAEISVSAIRHNLRQIRAELPATTRLCAVIKANAYGHGQQLLWPIIAEQADMLGVATPAEALHLRDWGYDGPLLVFFSACTDNPEPHLRATLDELLRREITLSMASRRELDLATKAARRTGCEARVHICVDTGMTRSGCLPADALPLIHQARLDPAIRLEGVYTHLACADEADKSSARAQLAVFDRTCAECGIDSGSGICRHAASSAGLIDLPESHYDMVRPGIAMYGCPSSDEMHRRLDLRPALRLTAHLMQVKRVPAGTRVGYGQTHEFTRETRVGLVPVGYGDGYLRALGNCGAVVRLAGGYAPVCGRVSMDQISIDLTDLDDGDVGDEVEIFSPDPEAPNSVQSLAALAGTIPYELMCRLGDRVRRFLVD